MRTSHSANKRYLKPDSGFSWELISTIFQALGKVVGSKGGGRVGGKEGEEGEGREGGREGGGRRSICLAQLRIKCFSARIFKNYQMIT